VNLINIKFFVLYFAENPKQNLKHLKLTHGVNKEQLKQKLGSPAIPFKL
jgi:hypothetical protein